MTAYASTEYLEGLKEVLEVFIPSTINESIKPKREAAIKNAYDGLYDIQMATCSIIGEIEVSHLLGMNEVVVRYFIDEYAKLAYVVKLIESKIKGLNAFNEIKPAVTVLKNTLKSKDISKHLYNDLETLAATYSVEIDLKASVAAMKKFEPSEALLFQLGIK